MSDNTETIDTESHYMLCLLQFTFEYGNFKTEMAVTYDPEPVVQSQSSRFPTDIMVFATISIITLGITISLAICIALRFWRRKSAIADDKNNDSEFSSLFSSVFSD